MCLKKKDFDITWKQCEYKLTNWWKSFKLIQIFLSVKFLTTGPHIVHMSVCLLPTLLFNQCSWFEIILSNSPNPIIMVNTQCWKIYPVGLHWCHFYTNKEHLVILSLLAAGCCPVNLEITHKNSVCNLGVLQPPMARTPMHYLWNDSIHCVTERWQIMVWNVILQLLTYFHVLY